MTPVLLVIAGVRVFFIGTSDPRINASRVANRVYIYDNSVEDVEATLCLRTAGALV